ncbi:MAG: beta-ketoacyl-[acyl-carrier-protein] synthase II, partial [Treponema sp.]|nr:beta-ketoacyl-[acyl-carrier-protein] synthase II [Treponema sp.]
MSRKVVVTGMGVVSPIGNSVDEFRDSLKAGKSGIAPITAFDITDFDVTIAGEVKNFDPARWMEKKDARKMCRFTQLAVAATSEALDQAGLVETVAAPAGEGRVRRVKSDPFRTGIVLGNG